MAASLQVQGYTPSAMLQETSMGIHYNGSRDAGWYLNNPEVLTPNNAGLLKIPNGAGLGIDLNEEKIREAALEGPTWNESSCYLYNKTTGCPLSW